MDTSDVTTGRYAPASWALGVAIAAVVASAVLLLTLLMDPRPESGWFHATLLLSAGAVSKLGLLSVALAALALVPGRGTPADQRTALVAAVLGTIVWGASTYGSYGIFQSALDGGF